MEVRSVGKQDLQWMLVQWQQDQRVRRNIVEREGRAWVSWQQELEARRFCGCRTAQEALSVVASKMTARLGVAFVRAQAKLLQKRVHLAEPVGAQRARDRVASAFR